MFTKMLRRTNSPTRPNGPLNHPSKMLIILSLFCCQPSVLWADIFSIDPSRTYLRTNLEQPGNSVPVSLSDVQIIPGDWIRLTQLGAFSYWGTNTPDNTAAMIGVFSGSDVLLPHSELHRVADAIDAGEDIATLRTAWQQLPTDIPEDFQITDIIIQVPSGATHLFAAAHDSFYSDNLDFNEDFSIELVLRPCEPAVNPGEDCNGNALDDGCEIAAGLVEDCNANVLPDECDIAGGTSQDSNDNGVPDECEVVDSDNDGLSDDDENYYHTDPRNPDTDADGLLDGTEVELANGGECPDPLRWDSDDDGLSDGQEKLHLGTNPCLPDTDGDRIPDGLDPFPSDAEGTSEYLGEKADELGAEILTVDLELFSGRNYKARAGRMGALSNRAAQAAEEIAAGNYVDAINTLESLLDRVDAETPPKDWIGDSDEKEQIAQQVRDIIILLEYLAYD